MLQKWHCVFIVCYIHKTYKIKAENRDIEDTCWSPLTTELVTSTEEYGFDKVTSFPLLLLYFFPGSLHVAGGVEGVRRGRGRLCLCVGGRGVTGGGEGGCRFEDSARSPRLPGSLKLFDDRTGQHHRGLGETGGGGGVWKPAICIQLFLSSCPAPLLLLLLLLLLLYLFLSSLLFFSSVAVPLHHLGDPFKLFKEVMCCSQVSVSRSRKQTSLCKVPTQWLSLGWNKRVRMQLDLFLMHCPSLSDDPPGILYVSHCEYLELFIVDSFQQQEDLMHYVVVWYTRSLSPVRRENHAGIILLVIRLEKGLHGSTPIWLHSDQQGFFVCNHSFMNEP